MAQIGLMSSGIVMAQATPPSDADASGAGTSNVIVVRGQRAALNSAQVIKQNADEIVDSIVADDIGKLPDRSVTEVLQRVAGVTVDHSMATGDPEHFSVEGSGLSIRGLTYVSSELNGRDSFSANGGRSLSFSDVPPELMAGVDVYKNPSAEQIEGAIGGLVNLRTSMPFDFKGRKVAISTQETYSELAKGRPSPSASALLSDRWDTGIGQIGILADIASSRSITRTDALQVMPYYPRTDLVPGQTVYIPNGVQYRSLGFDRKREGEYLALQWKNADAQSSLTYFKTNYNEGWNERAMFSQADPYNFAVANAAYDRNGNLVSGTLSDPADKGIAFNNDTRTATRQSTTQDISWNLRVRVSKDWTLTSDMQWVRSTTDGFDSTVATGLQVPNEQVSLGSGVPSLTFSAADRAAMIDPNNYYWAFTMEHMDRSVATEKAWKGDAKYDFDSPVLRDLRFGVRLTERESFNQNSTPFYNWQQITQPWAVGWNINHVASLGDPRFSANASVYNFNNFYGGSISVPSLIFPNTSLTTGFPGTYATLHSYNDTLCAELKAAQGWASCSPWSPATIGVDPAGNNDQKEKTQALYSQLRFGFDDLKHPVDGNAGVRYVRTQATANGYMTFSPSLPVFPPGATVTGAAIPNISAASEAQQANNTYDNVLTSLNLRMKATDALQFRLALSGAMARPNFSQMQAYTTLSESATTTSSGNNVNVDSVSLTGTASGNPMLKPTTSTQLDLTAEWYFAPAGSLTFAAFDKQLKNIIINELYNKQLPDVNGNPVNFVVTGPVNGADGVARGFEIGYQQYFDKLPGAFSGLGMQANFTFVDSHENLYSPVNQAYCTGNNNGAANLALNLNGCDTNGRTFGNLPLQNLSRQTYNLALLYDKGQVSARLAYNWRSKSFLGVNVPGTSGTNGTDTNPASSTYGQHNVAYGLPTWADAYGQLDGSLFYKIDDNLTFGLEAENLTNAKYTQFMTQTSGNLGRAWFVTGPRYTARLNYVF
ncbi:MAG TPA: TonB-dependent receptor [Burkholderiaceae bacterium]